MGFFGGGGGAASNMVGATDSVAGTAGLVPAPAAGEHGKVLNGDATFQSPRYPTKANTVLTNRAISPIGRAQVISSGNYIQYTGRMYFVPIYIPSTLTSWSIVLGVAVVTANATVGVYNYGADTGLPKTRIAKSASFSINNASGTTTFTTAFTDTLQRGIYFLAVSYSTTASVQGFNDQFLNWVGYTETTLNANLLRYTYSSYGTDDFPATINTANLVIAAEQQPRMFLTY